MIKCAEIPKEAVESTETLMEQEKITDKIDQMTDEPEATEQGRVMPAIGKVANNAETLPAV